MEIHSPKPVLPYIPDDQTVGQFVFDCVHPVRPEGKEGTPWLVEDATGRSLGKQEVSLVILIYGHRVVEQRVAEMGSSVNEPLL
jgi:hypothetical protein